MKIQAFPTYYSNSVYLVRNKDIFPITYFLSISLCSPNNGYLIEFLCKCSFKLQQSFEDAELKKKDVEEEEGKPDPLTQLVTTFNRGACTEKSGGFVDDLYMAYAVIMSK